MKRLLLLFGVLLGWSTMTYSQCNLTPVTLPISEGFENFTGPITATAGTDTVFDCNTGYSWSYYRGGSNGQLSFNQTSNTGTQSAVLACVTSGTYDTNYVTLTVNMSNITASAASDVFLSFAYRESGDEVHTPDRVWVRGSNTDSWIEILNWSSTASSSWQNFQIKIDSVVSANSQTFSASTQVRWGQYDNFTWGSDGFAFDDVMIQEVNCSAPTGFSISNLSATSVDLNWTNGGSTNTQIALDTAGFSLASANYINLTSGTSYTATGLSPATDYDVYIRDSCGAGDFSLWVGPISFKTACVPFSAPYANNFDTEVDGQVATCWAQYNNYNTFAYGRVENFGTPRSGSQQLIMYSYFQYATGDTLVSITPEFSDLTAGDKQIRFFVKTSDVVNDLIVGTSDTNVGGMSLNALDTISFASSNTFQEVIIPINAANGYNGTDRYVYFRHSLGGTFDYIYIDDLNYELIPPCPKITGFNLTGVTSNSFTFGYSTSGDSIDVEWGPAGFTQGTGCLSTLNSTAGSSTINNSVAAQCGTSLNGNTLYDVYIRNNCSSSGNGTSVWSGPFKVRTACNAFVAPYFQNFDSWTPTPFGSTFSPGDSLGPCWNRVPELQTYMWMVDNNGTGSGGTGPDPSVVSGNYMYTEASSGTTGSQAILTSPFVDISGLTTPYFSFDLHAVGSNLDSLVVEYWTGAAWDTLMLFVGAQQTSQTDPFTEHGDTIPALAVGSETRIRFVAVRGTSFAGDWAIDEFGVYEAPSCGNPTLITVAADSITSNSAYVYWTSGGAANSNIEWGTVGFTPGTGTAIGSATVVDTFYTITGLGADTDYEVYVRDSCGGSSGVSFWQGPVDFSTDCAAPIAATLPWTEGFENFTSGPSFQGSANLCDLTYSWKFKGTSSSSRLRLQAGTSYYNNGAQAATLDHNPSVSLTQPNYLTLTINLSNYTTSGGINLGFYYMSHGQEASPDNRVWARGSKSDPWIEVYNLDANSSGNGIYDSVGGIDLVLPLTNAGQAIGAETQIRFGQAGRFSSFSTNFSDGYTFDDISLEAVSCPNPSGLTLGALTDTSATLQWGANTNAAEYEIWFGNAGFYQGSTTVGGVKVYQNTTAGANFTVDTLTGQACYEYLIRYVCAPGDTSAYAGPFSFCTPCSPFFAPYVEDFDGANQVVGSVPECWDAVLEGGTGPFSAAYIYQFGTPRSSPNHVRFYNYNNSTTMLISPLLGDLDDGDKRVSFYVRESFGGGETVLVGTVPSPGAYAQFDTISTYTTTDQDFKFVTQLTTANGYNGTDKYVAILHGNTSSFNTLYIDDFVYEVIPTCPEPIGGNSAGTFAVDSNSAMIYWGPGSSSTGDYQVEYGTGALGSSTNTQMLFQNDTAALTGLLDGTDYCFWVRQICTPGDTSFWTGPVCFQTQCASKSAPYTMNFDSQASGEVPLCWTPLFRGGTAPFAAVEVYQFGTPNSAPNHMRFYNYNTDTTMAISPLFNDINAGDKRVRFEAMSTSTFGTNDLVVGTMSDIADGSTFNPLDTFTMTGSYAEYITEITTANGYNGTDNYVALLHASTSTFRTYYVDDFKYETIPTCAPRPSGFSAYAVGSADISYKWTGGSTGSTNFVVQYGTSGVLNDPTNTITAIANDSLTITGLTSNTNYCAWVAEVCTPGDTSIWEGPVCVATACLAFTAPYVEDFSGSTVGHWSGADNCWEFLSNNPGTTSSGGYSWEVRNTAQTTSSGTGPDRDATLWPTMGGKFITADVSGSSTFTPDSTVLTSPIIDISGLNNPELGYALHRYGSNMADLYVDVFDGTGWVLGVHSYTSLSGIQTSSGADWIDTTVSLSSYSGITNLRVRFRSVTNGCCAGDNAIDDVRISDPVSCSAPLAISATAMSSTSAEISWDTTGTGAATVELEYGATGFTLGTGTSVTGITATNYTITGLTTTNLCQDVYVRSICTSGDTSLWFGPISACPDETLCTDDFDQYATGAVDAQSALFVGWYGGAAGDGEVSTTRSSSGSNSLNITDQGSAGFTDVVAYFDTISSGAWELSWEMYVESNDGAYFNIQQNHALSGVGNQWNAELYFQSNGSVRVQHSAAATIVGNFNYTQGSWFTMSTIIDLDNDTIWFEVNGSPVNVGFTYSAANAGQPLQFNGVNFYSGVLAGQTYDIDYYVDDFCVQAATISTPCPLVNQLATANTACDETTVSWTSNSGGSIIEYGVAPLTPGTGTFTGIVTSPFTITGLMPGTNYDIRVADTCGTDTSGYRQQSITTASGPLPTASFTIDSAIVGGNYEVYVNASSSAGATSYNWDYGNGTTGSGMMDTASYGTNGSFTITLIVTNACGSDTATFTTNVNIGLDENALDRSLSIFPNPANNVVNVSFNEVGSGDVYIRLADAQGRTVMELSDKLGSSTYTKALDVSNLAAGVYMIEVRSGDMAAMRRISISK